MTSPAIAFFDKLATLGPVVARKELTAILDALSTGEAALLAFDWLGFWARENQRIPDGPWRSHGYLTARRVGKTRSNAEFVGREARSGRAMRIGFCAQNLDKTVEVMVHGDAGLIATSPPWCKAEFVGGGRAPPRVVWPNGAQAFPFTPEVPGAIRGPGVHLFWASELQSWPQATREEALLGGIMPMTTLGYGKLIWDATPKRRHPIIRILLERAERHPEDHVVVRGTIRDNIDNLGAAAVEELERLIGGTQRGREELEGIFFDESDGALWKQAWIDASRRDMPGQLKRRIISLDPAISDRKGTDNTGISDMGLGVDDQVLVIADYSGKHSWEQWGAFTVDHYMDVGCDCVVVETDRGGDGVAANIKAAAKERGLRVEVVSSDAPTRHDRSTIYIKEVRGRVSKGARAAPVATLCQKGRISHVRSGSHCDEWPHGLTQPADRPRPDLSALEDTLTTWEPESGGRSPDELDAMVHGGWELAGLGNAGADHSVGFKGIEKMAEALTGTPTRGAGLSLTELLGRNPWGSKI